MNKLGTVDSVNLNQSNSEEVNEPQTEQTPVVIDHSEIGRRVVNAPPKIEHDFPTEIVELPSKGLLYPKEHPLSAGTIEIKYMTAKEEDILSTESYIKQGVVLDKLCESIIVTKGVKYGDLLIGDKNALLFAARSVGYGPQYQTSVESEDGTEIPITINLDEIKHKELDESLIIPYENRFKFTLPKSGKTIEFKLLTVQDQKDIDSILKSYKKLGPQASASNLTTRLKKMILSVDGDSNPVTISKFIDNMLAIDSRAFREYLLKVQPDVDLQVEVEDPNTGEFFRSNFTIGVDLFYPDYKR
jgi:hypothetical protein